MLLRHALDLPLLPPLEDEKLFDSLFTEGRDSRFVKNPFIEVMNDLMVEAVADGHANLRVALASCRPCARWTAKLWSLHDETPKSEYAECALRVARYAMVNSPSYKAANARDFETKTYVRLKDVITSFQDVDEPFDSKVSQLVNAGVPHAWVVQGMVDSLGFFSAWAAFSCEGCVSKDAQMPGFKLSTVFHNLYSELASAGMVGPQST